MAKPELMVEVEGVEWNIWSQSLAALVKRSGGRVEITAEELSKVKSLIIDSPDDGETMVIKSE